MVWYHSTLAGTLRIRRTTQGRFRLSLGAANLGTFKTPEGAADYAFDHFSQRACDLFPGGTPPPDLSHWKEDDEDKGASWSHQNR